jgi:uncharacterized protein YdhG (YjbR/CyaY superfamily)
VKTNATRPTTIDEYIAAFPEEVRKILQTLREAMRAEAPQAEETIKYGMPTFTLHGNLVHFAAYKNHIGLYPTSSPMEAFKDELSAYKTSRGAIQFPIDRPLPLPLIRRIVAYRVRESTQKSAATSKG